MNKTVRISFADTSGGQIREWPPTGNSGVLTVKVLYGFLHFTCRNLALEAIPGPIANREKSKTVMSFGFEGAMSPADVESYEVK